MGLKSGKRATTASVTATLGGLAAILSSILRNDLEPAIGGLGLTVTGLTALILVTIRKWVTDTREETSRLADAQHEAQSERARYVALQAALEAEQGRLIRDMAADRAALDVRLKAEREAMAVEFEAARTKIVNEAMETLAGWVVNGKIRPPEHETGKLIRFPEQQPQGHPQRERSREHGVVSP